MSFGKMNKTITIFAPTYLKDKDAFTTTILTPVVTRRAYVEYKNLTERWANKSILKDAECVITFRFIDGITNDCAIKIDEQMFDIISVENVRGKGFYIQVVAKYRERTDGED